jgi:hypothetical protein
MLDNTGRDHHVTHQELLQEAGNPSSAWPWLDAIIVPTIRPPSSLTEAAKLARILNCTLVTLHSGARTTAESAIDLLPADIDLIAIDVTQPPDLLHLPPWETSSLLKQEGFDRLVGGNTRMDVSTKRNLALMLSRMLDWSRILFLDDDITAPNPEDIKQASGLLETHNAVGLRIGGFPDNSVVCHAYRRAGGPQKSFIGAGALAIETERCTSFFPDIYNDDWLFMLDPDGWLQPVTCTGEVNQASFDPYRADRARAEELGDVLAEGFYWLLHQDQPVFNADEKHWDAFLLRRRNFILRVLDMVESRIPEGSEKNRIDAALTESLAELERITSDVCQRYVQAWRADRDLWLSHVSDLPTGQAREDALDLLSAPEDPLPRCLTRGDESDWDLSLDTALWSPG